MLKKQHAQLIKVLVPHITAVVDVKVSKTMKSADELMETENIHINKQTKKQKNYHIFR